MQYVFAKEIRIKTCVDKSFFVNIKNNSIVKVSTDALKYLQQRLSDGLTADDLAADKSAFGNFVVALKQRNILETVPDET